MGEYVSTQTLVIHRWAGPSVVAQLAPDSTPDKAHFSLWKNVCLGYPVLLRLVVCLTLLASFFLPYHLSLKHVHVYLYMHVHVHVQCTCIYIIHLGSDFQSLIQCTCAV